jgi:CheY-like chemotaxis protein
MSQDERIYVTERGGYMGLGPEFIDQVRDALLHLCDYMYLQTHPLADLLLPHAIGDGIRAKMLRQGLVQAIEELKPEPSTPIRSPEWRGYRILYLRCVEGLDTDEIATELAISRSQFYREHRKALDAVAALLWDRISRSKALGEGEGLSQKAATTGPSEDLIQAEIKQLVLHSTKEILTLDQTIEHMRDLFLEFAAAKGVQLRLEVPAALPPIHVGHTVLRQILLNVLSQGLRWTSPEGIVTVAAAESEDHVIVEVNAEGVEPEGCGERDGEDMSSLVVARRLVESQGGQMQALWNDRRIRIALPIADTLTVLVVDDNEDMIRLLRRYLNGHRYQVVEAQNSEEALRIALKLRPQIITLDVMMPNRDGWEALQTLKNHPRTCDIPVLVCSILDEPDLALSLGAWGYLRKPISQEELLSALERLRTSPGTGAQGSPG